MVYMAGNCEVEVCDDCTAPEARCLCAWTKRACKPLPAKRDDQEEEEERDG